jgi:hypothetical protein
VIALTCDQFAQPANAAQARSHLLIVNNVAVSGA